MRTSAGSFPSNKVGIARLIAQLQVTTHTMENLTGIFPCFGAFSNDGEIDVLIEVLDRIGASYSDDLTAENTHLICSLPRVHLCGNS